MKGELISAVMAVAIVASSAIIVVSVITPTIEEGRSTQAFNDAKKTLESLDAAMAQVLFEAPGSRRVIDINLPRGKLTVAGNENRVKIRLDDLKLFTPGLRKLEGNIIVTSGSEIEPHEEDVDNDGYADLVLENSAVKFAIRKIGSPASPGFVNTTDIITLIRNKRLNLDIWKPRSAVYVNESARTSYGTGYTELAEKSDFLTTSGIHIFVNATDVNITYDAVFTLGPNQDFLEFYVTHVTGL